MHDSGSAASTPTTRPARRVDCADAPPTVRGDAAAAALTLTAAAPGPTGHGSPAHCEGCAGLPWQVAVYPWARLGILHTMREGKINELNM